MSSPVYDVVIIGGGIVGAACAAECAAEGLRVAIVEAKMIGGGATAAGMGHLTVMDDSAAQFALTRYSQLLWEGLRDELPLEVEYDACGTIWVAADDDEMREVERKHKFYSERDVAVEVLDAQSLKEAEPNLREGLVGGLRVAGDSVIYPPCLRHQLVELGYLKSAHTMTAESVAFNIQPRKTGQLLIGSSRQFEVDETGVDVSILNRMLSRAIEFLPRLGKLSSLRAWTGFRAATPDKLPLIGPDVEHPRLYLATGHEGLGITTSMATAKLLVDQIVNRTPAIPIAPYLPSRVAMIGAELAHV